MKRVLVLAVAIFSWAAASAQSNGVPIGFIQKTFYIRAGNVTGTAFGIQYKGNQYLVTAKHVVKDLPNSNAHVHIFRTGDWKEFSVSIHTPKNPEVDIAVLSLGYKFMADEIADFGELSSAHLNFGGEVYFLGYPYGLHSLFGPEYVPFVKKGVLSAIDSSDPTAVIVYVDGFNNEGFSGGPVIAYDAHDNTWRIIGVIQGYVTENASIRVKNQSVAASTLVNSGILVAFHIKHVMETIDSNEKSSQSPAPRN